MLAPLHGPGHNKVSVGESDQMLERRGGGEVQMLGELMGSGDSEEGVIHVEAWLGAGRVRLIMSVVRAWARSIRCYCAELSTVR